MPNYEGNKKIVHYGAKTRFGSGSCPYKAQKLANPPWSIRKALLQILEWTFDATDPLSAQSMIKIFDPCEKK
jgi:hypothetical protein